MKHQYVDTLQEGDTVNDYFLAVRKDLRDTQAGKKFLGLVFRDRTGEIGGIHWSNAEAMARGFNLGDVVTVRAKVQTYQDRLQLKVESVLPMMESDYDIEDIVSSGLDVNALRDEYQALLKSVENEWLRKLLDAFWDDEAFLNGFVGAAAGKRWHHSYRGGLLEHCLEMARLVEAICAVYPELNRDIMMAATLLHDAGKLYELSQDLAVDYTDEGKLLGHLVIGSQMIQRKIDAIDGFPENLRLHIQHLIVSHHGLLENGSPVVPKSREALVFHKIDDIGAQMNAWGRINEESRSRNSDWSDYIGLIGQQVWTGGK
jgi:3'-5' exoribonuclease